MKVRESLRKIPYGESSTYSDLATKIGHPQAIRATGSAIGKNPFLIVNPCHRVLRKDGNIGGFAYGNEVKKFLLDLENITYNL
nr:MGMT family protein [uncultured Anaerococcus sp.]